MKRKRLVSAALIGFVIVAMLASSCKKDKSSSSSSTETTSTVNQVQASESQDAVSDKVETDVDNQIDDLEANNFSLSAAKTASDSSCVTITVDSTGGKSWPKTVTLVYNCQETINGELFDQSGTVIVTVDTTNINGERGYTRKVNFIDYALTTDSSTLILNGTRTLTRTKIKKEISSDLKKYRLEMIDSITSNLSFSVKYLDYNGSGLDTTVTFTRVTAKSRDMVLNFTRVGTLRKWTSVLKNDTITFNGKVTGIDIIGKNYERTIISPLIVTFCPIWPHTPVISTGTIELTVNGTNLASISYSAIDCVTSATLTTADGKVKNKKINRKFGFHLNRWW
jgi:hypothetical protein